MSTKVDGMRKEYFCPAALGFAACYQRDARNKGNEGNILPQKGATSVAPNFRDFCEFPCDLKELVGHFGFELLGLVDHLLNLRDGGHTATDVELGVDLLQLRLQVLSHTVTELLDGVDASFFQQLSRAVRSPC